MKVVIISFLGRSGLMHYTSQLSNSLSADHQVTVIIPSHAETDNFNRPVNLIKINCSYQLPRLIVNSMNIFAIIRLMDLIKNEKPDVIHIVNTHPWNVFLLRMKGVKKVYTIHDPAPHEENLKTMLYQPMLSLVDRLTVRWADRVIVHGKALKELCVSRGISPGKIAVMPLGDFSFFLNYKGTTVHEKNGKKNILFFGRIERYKGLEYFITAAREISKSHPDVSFTIAGEGSLEPYKNLLADSNITIINRYLDNYEVNGIFNACDIVVLPYISATQSGVIPIAYAFAKPVIATNVGSIPEVVDDGVTGIIVPPKDAGGLVDAIGKLLNDDDLRVKMGKNAYDKMKSTLSWEHISRLTNDLYDEIH